MMRKKKILSLFLAMVMVTGILPVNAETIENNTILAEETDKQQEIARGIYREPFLSGTVQTDLYVGDIFDADALYHRVLADDLEDGDLSYQIEEIYNDVDTGEVGEYKVSYEVTDSDGNRTTIDTRINVLPKDSEITRTIQRKLYTLGNASHLTDISFNRGYYHDRQSLGIWLPAEGKLEIRLVNPEEFHQNLEVTFMNQDEKTETKQIIPKNGEWVTLTNTFEEVTDKTGNKITSRESVPFIITPKNTIVQPIVEFKWTEDIREIPYYRYKDNEEEFFEKWDTVKWDGEVSPYAIIEGSAATFLVPVADRNNIINYSGINYGGVDSNDYNFDTIDEMLEWYAGFVDFYDEFVGLDYHAKESYNQNLRSKFFIYANESGVGLAYYTFDHSAFNGPQLGDYFIKSWLSLHEFGHGYEGALADQEYSFVETTNNILAYHFMETFRKESDWGWLLQQFAGNTRDEKWANMEQRVLSVKEQYTSFSEIVGENVKAYDVTLYMFVNLLEKLGPKEGVQAMHGLYRELYAKTGKLPSAGSVIMEGLGSVGDYNLIPYFSTFYIEPGEDAASRIYEKDNKILYSLKDIVPDAAQAWKIKEKLGLSGVYSLVTTDELAYTGYTSNVTIRFAIDDMEQIRNKHLVIKNGSKVVENVLISGEEVTVNLPIGAYEIELPVPDTKVYKYENEYVIAQKGQTSLEVTYEKETGNPLIDDMEIRMLGLSDATVATIKTDSSEEKLIWETEAVQPHYYFAGVPYVTVQVTAPESEEVIFERSIAGEVVLEKERTEIPCPIGTKLVISHMEAHTEEAGRRLRMVSAYTNADILAYNAPENVQTLSYIMTEKGWMLADWNEAKQNRVYKSLVTNYSDYVLNCMNSTDLQDSSKFYNEKLLLSLASQYLGESEKQNYEENYGILIGKEPEYYLTYERIPSETLIAQADTEQPEEGTDDCALDDNIATYWHSNYIDVDKTINMEENINNGFTILLEQNTNVGKLEYLPRSTPNGRILKYDLYYSETEDKDDFKKITINDNTWDNDNTRKTIEFNAPNARRIRVCAKETEGTIPNTFITAAEFYLYERTENSMKQRDIYLSNLLCGVSKETTVPKINTNAVGMPITLLVDGKTKTFEKGIGLLGNAAIEYDLTDRTFDYLTATIGIESSQAESNMAKVHIYGDDKQIYSSGKLSPGKNAEQISISLKGIKKLKIVTTDAAADTMISLADTKLYLEKDCMELSLFTGEVVRVEENMTIYKNAEKWCSWTSSNESVATVDEMGNITALAEGSTKITAVGKNRTISSMVTVKDSEKLKPEETPQEKPEETLQEKPQETPQEKPQEKPEETPQEKPQEKPQETPQEKPQEKPEETPQEKPKKNAIINDKGNSYKVTKAGTKNAEVSFQKPKKNAKVVTIPNSIKVKGITYKVTAIEKNAFKNHRTISKITIGKNIIKIGDNAFYGCTKLTSITIPSKVKTMGANVFGNCKKLKKITIQSTKLTKKTLAKNTFKGVIKSAKIRVPKAKVKTYKNLFRSKGLNTKVAVIKK